MSQSAERLRDILASLSERHRAALGWFIENTGTIQRWPKPLPGPAGEVLLASKAKGIYKPTWMKYALSVRQSLDGPYPDREPIIRSDGTWIYSYFQENADPLERDSEYTNRGLIECWHDRVPVGVMRQVSRRPSPRYRIYGLALVGGRDGGYFFLEGFAPDGSVMRRGPIGELELLSEEQIRRCTSEGIFDPTTVIDGRERIVASIVRRRGQPVFRADLLRAYGGRCAISGYDVTDALEASHIMPYHGPATNHVQNGLLLRSDLHTLFDLGLLAIDGSTTSVLLAPPLRGSAYADLQSARLRMPEEREARPNEKALEMHRAWTGL